MTPFRKTTQSKASNLSRMIQWTAAAMLAGALVMPAVMVMGQVRGSSVVLNSKNSERNLPSQAVAFASVPLPVFAERSVPSGSDLPPITQTIPYNINVGITVIVTAREDSTDVAPAVAELREIEPLVAERFYETIRPGSRISFLDLGSIRERLSTAATEQLDGEFSGWNQSNDFRITVVLSRISITDASVQPAP